ncbi:Gfo/Idh/MocA family protein [Tropicimonas sp. IMCC6043]|uniref:Gfo/Idh/MocA family protein n=1 Tax=Tropicimonas sp. IMCC6043 TaxID=2510645 RepID=UPI00101DCE82|nr:Gfo/Idh/MocA family oxidoreductase [Tropicimonas sp. IMCC6043]RYH10178.1 Gfo/Idh/MocA family oxidoreductase [Tropicimonas sp. IMCC6043]
MTDSGSRSDRDDAAAEDAPAIVVIGAGLIGRTHAERVARLARLDCIVDPAPQSAEIAATLGVPWFADLDSCLAARRPEGAIVATPNRLHAVQGLQLIAAGIPTLMEKPIAITSAEGAALVDAAEAEGVPLLVGHHRRHNPLIATTKAAIEAGKLGKIVSVNGMFWLYKPDDYFDQAWRRAPGAGPILINLIHDIDLMRHLCGEVRRVQALASRATRGFEVEDSAAILLEFANGALGTMSVSDTISAPWSWELTAGENPAYPHTREACYRIGGTAGALSLPDLTLWSHPGQRSWWAPIRHDTLSQPEGDSLDRQTLNLVEVIRGRAAPVVSGRDGLQTLRVVEAIAVAAAEGTAQDVPEG